MHLMERRSWEIPESLATPEALFLDRRKFLVGIGAAGALASSGGARAQATDPSAAFYPAPRNPAYALDRDVTPQKYNLNYTPTHQEGEKWVAKLRIEDSSVGDDSGWLSFCGGSRRPDRVGA